MVNSSYGVRKTLLYCEDSKRNLSSVALVQFCGATSVLSVKHFQERLVLNLLVLWFKMAQRRVIVSVCKIEAVLKNPLLYRYGKEVFVNLAR